MARKVTFDNVRKLALSLPGAEEGTMYGGVAFRVGGRMFACQPTHRSAEPDSLVVRIDFEQRDELLRIEPDTYYIKEHYLGYPSILVRLSRVHPDALSGLLRTAYNFVGSKSKTKPATGKRRTKG
jgi:hypothetical protein